MAKPNITFSANFDSAFHATWNAIAADCSFCETNEEAVEMVIDADRMLMYGNAAAHEELNSLLQQYEFTEIEEALAARFSLV